MKDLPDSGKRQSFNTGAVRDCEEGKGFYHLLSPMALRRLAVHMENGARKYEARNWEKGIPLVRYFDSALRHLYKWLEGRRYEHEDEDHLAAAMWNIHGMIHTDEEITAGNLPKSLREGLPHYGKYTAPVPKYQDEPIKNSFVYLDTCPKCGGTLIQCQTEEHDFIICKECDYEIDTNVIMEQPK